MRLPTIMLGLLTLVACSAAPDKFSCNCDSAIYPVQRAKLLAPEEIQGALNQQLRSNSSRADKLREMFANAGCPKSLIEEQDVSGSGLPNLICTLTGTGTGNIIIGAHFDKVIAGQGIADNWSGASLLPALYKSLAAFQYVHTITFVAFTDEEKDLVGSRYFVNHLNEHGRRSIRAMVNLDTLGLGPAKVDVARSDFNLTCIFFRSAATSSYSLRGIDVKRAGTSDADPFRRVGIPVIDIHSITTRTLPVLHGSRDNIDAVDFDAYYASYRLVLQYIAVLDETLGTAQEAF